MTRRPLKLSTPSNCAKLVPARQSCLRRAGNCNLPLAIHGECDDPSSAWIHSTRRSRWPEPRRLVLPILQGGEFRSPLAERDPKAIKSHTQPPCFEFSDVAAMAASLSFESRGNISCKSCGAQRPIAGSYGTPLPGAGQTDPFESPTGCRCVLASVVCFHQFSMDL